MDLNVNKSYIDLLASEIRAMIPKRHLPDEEVNALFRVYAVLALAKGNSTTAEDVHDAWSAWMASIDPTHPSLVPFSELDPSVAKNDLPYLQAVLTVASLHRGVHRGDAITESLFPRGTPSGATDGQQLFELYKLMVGTSEELVSRRQGVNTFFVTVNGALLTGVGLLLGSRADAALQVLGLTVLGATGLTLAMAWRSRIKSFGQLNTGKFAVISRLENYLAASIFDAEWKALGEGIVPKKYRTFTSREMWLPWTFFAVYLLVVVGSLGFLLIAIVPIWLNTTP